MLVSLGFVLNKVSTINYYNALKGVYIMFQEKRRREGKMRGETRIGGQPSCPNVNMGGTPPPLNFTNPL